MLKKAFIVAICAMSFFCGSVYAADISAEAACVISADTGEVIFEKNAYERHSMASTTKIMTGLLAVESGKGNEVVTISKNAQNQEGSSVYLREGERILLSDLTYALMLNSGNDAAVAIAEYLAGSCDAFAERMTARARELGAKNTSFKNPNGLEAEGHYTTAFDLAAIGAAAIKNKQFEKIVSTKSKTVRQDSGQFLYLTNHNKLLKSYEGAVGIKTGFTKAAGRCLVSAAERDGGRLVAVTLNAPDDWNDHKKLLDEAFEKTTTETVVKKGEVLKKIKKGEREYTFSAAEDVFARTLDKGGFEVRVYLPKEAPVPIAAGEKAGYAKIFKGNKLVKNVDIVSDCDIAEKDVFEKKTFFECLKNVLTALI